MRIAIANAKGGVAKTTTAMYLGAACAARDLPAVVLDADPQSSASLWSDMAGQGGDPLPFRVEPANLSTLRGLERRLPADVWAFVDAPPSGPLLEAALACADFVVVPTSDSPIDLQQAWATMAAIPQGTPAAVLIARAETRTKAFDLTLAALDEQHTPCFDAIVRKRQDIKSALDHAPSKLHEYGQVLQELVEAAR